MSAAGKQIEFPILIGDIGGTNARFAVIADAESAEIEFPVVQTRNFATINDAISETVLKASPVAPRSAILAIAGPVDGDEIPLTNCPWIVRPRTMISELGLSDVIILNDFEAQALAAVALGPVYLEKLGGGEPEEEAPRLVLGPGTGLGVAGLVHALGRWIPVPGEGGHMDLGPRTPRDFDVFPHIARIDGRVSGEQILCGRGMVNLYRAVCAADGVAPKYQDPADISMNGLAGADPQAAETLSLFAAYLGRTAGDLALVFLSRGGVYLTGGIAQKILPALKAPELRAAFEDKAPHSAMMRDMPIYVITHPLAALQGLATFSRKQDAFGIETKGRRWIE